MQTPTYAISLNFAESHPRDFTINRSSGTPGFLFLHFTTAVHLHSIAGNRYEKSGAAILYEPQFPQWYTGVELQVTHDWMYFSGDSTDFQESHDSFPLNTVFYLADSSFLAPLFRQIQTERLRQEAGWEEVVSLLIQQFLLLLSRHRRLGETDSILTSRQKWIEQFTSVRMEVLGQLQLAWDVPQIASHVGLSTTRFAVLYKEFFGVSPIEDLIRARLERARWLLTSSGLTVTQVSEHCGFESIHHFSRLFRQRVGCAPSSYPLLFKRD